MDITDTSESANHEFRFVFAQIEQEKNWRTEFARKISDKIRCPVIGSSVKPRSQYIGENITSKNIAVT
jgi:hypothetical protein